MRAITEPDLAVLLGQLAGREPLSDGAVRAVIDRWRQVDAVTVARPLTGLPRVVWLTPAGGQWIGQTRVKAPSPSRLMHTCAVARARLLLTSESSTAVQWTSERAIRAELLTVTSHVPDARVVTGSQRAAIEVELTAKPIREVAKIMGELATDSRYDVVQYLTGTAHVAGVCRQARELAAEEEARKRARVPMDPRRHVDPTRVQIGRVRERMGEIFIRSLPEDLRAAMAAE